jgi:hypothetical protein
MHLGPTTSPKLPDDADGVNRRKHGRVKVEGLTCSWGRILDLSGGGARVRMNLRCPSIGQLIQTTLPTPGGDLNLAARVVWARKVGLMSWEIGCEFVALDAASQRLLLTAAEGASPGFDRHRPRDVA